MEEEIKAIESVIDIIGCDIDAIIDGHYQDDLDSEEEAAIMNGHFVIRYLKELKELLEEQNR